MKWFLKSIDYDLRDVIQNGPYILTKIGNRVAIKKSSEEWDDLNKKKVQLNARPIYYFHRAIDSNEYNKVCQCESTKDIWRLKD